MAGALMLALLVAMPGAASAADEMAATETAVAIPAGGYDIAGTLALPADAEGPVPWVEPVLEHLRDASGALGAV